MIEMRPIAVVKNERHSADDDRWGDVISTIELLPPLTEDALLGIENFSHVEILFYFNQAEENRVETGSRHPRGNPDWPRLGILAQRGKDRPNHIGATICPLLGHNGKTITVRALDAIDGTPVLDIKPVMREFLPGEEVHQPDWAGELMKRYWK